MSILKVIKARLGLHNTTTENHFFDGSVANTLSLKKGTPEVPSVDVMTVDSAGKVAFPQNAQTLQDVKTTPGRLSGTTYTNNTGQTIWVMVSMTSSLSNGVIVATVGGVAMAGNQSVTSSVLSSITFSVPSGVVYSVAMNTGVSTINNWVELR